MATISSKAIIFFLIAFTFLSISNVFAEEYKVGGEEGWHEPSPNNSEAYEKWAEDKIFHIGDTLRFEYEKNDTVIVVDKFGYYHCNATKPYSIFHDGNTAVNLTHPGNFFFASADSKRCNNGQKLMVQVFDPRRSTHSSSIGLSVSIFFDMLFSIVVVSVLM